MTFTFKRNRVSLDRLRSSLDYNPDTGVFLWKISPVNSVSVGSRAGTLRLDGYRAISIDRRQHLEHVLAWLYMTGSYSDTEIDHINIDKADNKWANLRSATLSQNRLNVPRRRDNTSGFKGVSYHKATKSYSARIQIDGKRIELGRRRTAGEAAILYADACATHPGGYTRTK